ncbi:hypothetical protein AHAS_Ahas18G0162500 [Arachis hypogaea]
MNQCVTLEIDGGGRRWIYSAVYGSPQATNRVELWSHLLDIGLCIQDPWVVVGDFNDILSVHEVKGDGLLGSVKFKETKILQRDWIELAVLQNGAFFFQKLLLKFSVVPTLIIVPYLSDVKEFLSSFGIHRKLLGVQEASLEFNSTVFGNIFIKKRELEGYLNHIQRKMEADDDPILKHKEEELRAEYNIVLAQEELLWYQKSRDQWVRYGDRNNSFFHMQTIVRRKYNKVHGLLVSDGSWSDDPEVLQREIVHFFKNIFCSTEPVEVEDVWHHGHWRWDMLCTMIPEEVKLDLMLFDPIKQAGDKTEDINHCFRTCQKARQIWISLNLGMTAEDSSLKFVSWIRSNLNKNEFLFAAAFWWIWMDRNNDIFHQDDPWSKEKIVHLVKHAARDFSNVVINQKHIIPSSLKYNWEPPPMNVCKVNCDASVFENEQLAGFGCIIRDSMGIWIKGCSASIPLSSVLCCELHAIWRGLVMAWDCECKEVICETDNLDAFLLVSRSTTSMIRNDSGLLDKIKEMLQRNWTATLVLIQRTANKAADLMAKTAILNKQVYLE